MSPDVEKEKAFLVKNAGLRELSLLLYANMFLSIPALHVWTAQRGP